LSHSLLLILYKKVRSKFTALCFYFPSEIDDE